MSAEDNKSLVSIGLPVYNGENYIRQALDSLLAQDYENFELIISDNASTDSTQEICREYASRDSRIQYYRNAANLGIIRNFNRVFELSSGRYFMWAAHDDVWEQDFVSRCEEVLRSSPSAILCYPQAKLIRPDDEIIEAPFPFFDTRARDLDPISRFHVHIWGMAQHPYPIYGLIRSDVLKRTGLFGDLFGACLILLAELSLLGGFAYVPAPLYYIRLQRRADWLDGVDAISEKVNKPVTTKWSALYWYLEMVYGHAKVVNKHVNGYRGKAILIPSAIFVSLIKWRWLLKSMLDLSKRKQGK